LRSQICRVAHGVPAKAGVHVIIRGERHIDARKTTAAIPEAARSKELGPGA
jgi:hypothetical protein